MRRLDGEADEELLEFSVDNEMNARRQPTSRRTRSFGRMWGWKVLMVSVFASVAGLVVGISRELRPMFVFVSFDYNDCLSFNREQSRQMTRGRAATPGLPRTGLGSPRQPARAQESAQRAGDPRFSPRTHQLPTPAPSVDAEGQRRRRRGCQWQRSEVRWNFCLRGCQALVE